MKETSAPILALLLTGTLGSGKTALAVEIGEVLEERDLPHAVVDLDWLGWVHPGPGHDDFEITRMISENLEAIWPRFLSAGVRYLVLARLVEGEKHLNAILRAIPDADLTVVRVEASAETIGDRLRRRDTGATLDKHLREAAAFTEVVEAANVEDWVVSNDGRSLRDVAIEVVRRLGWVE